jgi:ribosomal protein L11 methyltransferase
VYELPRGDEVELRVRGGDEEMPTREAVAATAGEWADTLTKRFVPDDWHARRLLDYEPRVVAGRLVVRPAWAPPAAHGLIDLVLEEADAFGAGGHPTTWACLERVCALEPGGTFADLGCGSGVLAIAASLLGFDDVIAVDHSQSALAATRANAERNGVTVRLESTDLCDQPAPAARVVIANVPQSIHASIAMRLADETETLIASGVLISAADAVADCYANAGLTEAERRESGGWAVLTLSRPRTRE